LGVITTFRTIILDQYLVDILVSDVLRVTATREIAEERITVPAIDREILGVAHKREIQEGGLSHGFVNDLAEDQTTGVKTEIPLYL